MTDQTTETARRWRIFCVPGSHFDYGWCGTQGACFARLDHIVRAAIDAIEGDVPGYRFTVEFLAFLDHFLKAHPEYRDRVVALIRERKLGIGSTWTGPMEQVLDGEALVREVTIAKRWARAALETESRVAQLSDTPGHTAQLPQILSKSGVHYLAFSRYCPPIRCFRWQAPDGSQVIAAHHTGHYGWGERLRRGIEFAEEHLPTELRDAAKDWPEGVESILMGDEHDLCPGITRVVETAAEWNQRHPEAQVTVTTIGDFFRSLEAEADRLPTYSGEAPYGFSGLAAVEAAVYPQARRAEAHLLSAEKLSALRRLFDLGSVPEADFDAAWRNLFYCHDHNIGGKHGDVNDRGRLYAAQAAFEEADRLFCEATSAIGDNIRHRQPGLPLVVFNALSWPWSGAVRCDVTYPGEVAAVTVRDREGTIVPRQVVRRETLHKTSGWEGDATRFHLLFVADQAPPLGYTSYYATPEAAEAPAAGTLTVTPDGIQNEWRRIALSDGEIASCFCKPGSAELAGARDHRFGQVVAVENDEVDIEERYTGREWPATIESAEVVESGPVRATIRRRGRVHEMPFTLDVSMYAALPQIEFALDIDWQAPRNVELRLAFPFGLDGGAVTYESPFYAVPYPEGELEDTYRGTGTRYLGKWVDCSIATGGVTVASLSNNYHLPPGEPTIEGIPIRAARSCGDAFYWAAPAGRYRFLYSLLPHRGDWRESRSYRHGWEVYYPLSAALLPMPTIWYGEESVAAPERYHQLPSPPFGALADHAALCRADGDHIVITALRPQDDGSYMVRLYDAEGRGGDARLEFAAPVAEAAETDMLGRPILALDVNGSSVNVPTMPWGIHTLRVRLKA
jgi:alpha-mannosidase